MGLVEILVLIVVAAIIFYLVIQVISPRLPDPWGNVLVVVVALVFVLFLLTRFFPSIAGMRVGGPLVPPVAAEVDWSEDHAGDQCPCSGEPAHPYGPEENYPIPG